MISLPIFSEVAKPGIMREHAIPQDVVGYRFHIVGNMTLKQFLEVGAGCVIGLLIYQTNLINIIKWPLIGIFVALGALAAFVPFEERPLDHWFVTFFKVLYKPTKFFWRREPKVPDVFLFKPTQTTNLGPELDLTPARRQRIKDYLGSIENAPATDQLDIHEVDRINTILGQFQSVTVTEIDMNPMKVKPNLKVSPHSLKRAEVELEPDQVVTTTQVTVYPEEQAHIEFSKQGLDISQVARNIVIPELAAVDVSTTYVDPAADPTQTEVVDDRSYSTEASATTSLSSIASQASLNTDLPFPIKPTEPNKLVGMTLTPHNELINDAIIEIQSEAGQVVRAVKTNALGQFFVTTPLPSGNYTLVAEKDGFEFQPQNLQLLGNAVDPIEIRSVT